MTVGVLLLTHEGIGTSLMRVARRLFGAEPELPLDAYEATWDDDADTQLPAASAALRRVDRGDGVLLLALGLRDFSLHPGQLLEVRRAVRAADFGSLRRRAASLLRAHDRAGIEAWLAR